MAGSMPMPWRAMGRNSHAIRPTSLPTAEVSFARSARADFSAASSAFCASKLSLMFIAARYWPRLSCSSRAILWRSAS